MAVIILGSSKYITLAINFSGHNRVEFQEGTQEYYIQKLTKPGEPGFIDMNLSINVNKNRPPAVGISGIMPWYNEWFEDEVLVQLKRNKPKVISFNPEGDIWGYKLSDYAQNIISYIEGNYIYAKEISLWIRNDYYEEALNKLGFKKAFFDAANFNGSVVLKDNVISQYFSSSKEILTRVDVLAGTYARVNKSKTILKVRDVSNDKILEEITFNNEDLEDNDYHIIEFSDPIILKKGKQYATDFYPIETNENDFIAIYTDSSLISNNNYAAENQEKQQFNLCIKLYKD